MTRFVRKGSDLRAGDVILLDGTPTEALSVYDNDNDNDNRYVEVHVDLARHGYEVVYLRKDCEYPIEGNAVP